MADEHPAIRYATGEPAHVGDRLDYDDWKAVVEHVLATNEDLDSWGLNEPGIMIRTVEAGLIFCAASLPCWDAILLLGRGDDATSDAVGR